MFNIIIQRGFDVKLISNECELDLCLVHGTDRGAKLIQSQSYINLSSIWCQICVGLAQHKLVNGNWSWWFGCFLNKFSQLPDFSDESRLKSYANICSHQSINQRYSFVITGQIGLKNKNAIIEYNASWTFSSSKLDMLGLCCIHLLKSTQ